MSKLQTTIDALQGALADVPEAPAAWVPLRRSTVEEALRVLGSVHGVLAPMKALAAEIEGERQKPAAIINVAVGDTTDYGALAKRVVAHINGSVSAMSTGNHNGTAVTVADPQVPSDWTHGEALYVELHRLAQDGVGPSKARWNVEAAKGMPPADVIIGDTGKRWFAILEEAGLRAPVHSPDASMRGTPAAVAVDDDQLRSAVYVEMRRLALGSAGPSKTRWDDERAPDLPKSDELIGRLGARWIVLVKEAGLMPPNAGPRRNVPAPAEAEVAADEAELFRG